jgi:nucleoside-diphosphate-sugar epimerase
MNMDKRIIITGANGFIGSHIIAELIASNTPVSAVVKNTSNYDVLKKLKCYNVIGTDNLIDPTLIRRLTISKPDYFVHCAWSVDHGKNITTLVEAIKLAKILKCKGFVSIGSYEEYGIEDDNLDESQVCVPKTEFGKVKYAYYLIANTLCNKEEINHCHVRLSIPYSIRENEGFYFTKVIKAISKGEEPAIISPFNSKDYIHASDIARGIIALIKNDSHGLYNLGAGEATKNKMLLNMIYEAFKKDFKQVNLNDKDQNQLNSFFLNNNKIYQATRWKPTISIWDGISLLVNQNKFSPKANFNEFTSRIRNLCK